MLLFFFWLLLDEWEHQISFDTTLLYTHIPAFLGDRPTIRSFHDYRYLFLFLLHFFANLAISVLALHDSGSWFVSAASSHGVACRSEGRCSGEVVMAAGWAVIDERAGRNAWSR